MTVRRLASAALLLALAACQPPSPATDAVTIEGLGTLTFPNSGAAEAQDDFLRGVLLLHSFEYRAAAESFERALEIDDDFALAAWGLAMTSNHPLWKRKDTDSGRAALARLGATAEERREKAPTEREKMYLDALEALYADGSKTETDRAYMEALQRLHNAYPDDHEARAFYALSILGSVDGNRDFATYMRAGATAQPVFDANPQHPGAAHYLIHSYDDPIHAPLGLPAARTYADIAPHAAHAQHMTTHIFLALGLWDEVVTGNIRARDTQDADRAARDVGPNRCGHYSSWLQYGHLQRGEADEAAELLDLCHESLDESSPTDTWGYFASMRARQIVDTEDWSLSDRWQADVPATQNLPWQRARLLYESTNALAALRSGDTAPARELIASATADRDQELFQLEQLRGLVALEQGRSDEGLELLATAAARAEALPFGFGPPSELKPAFELLGEELLKAGRVAEAEDAFRTAVSRTPGRVLAEQGLERTTSPTL